MEEGFGFQIKVKAKTSLLTLESDAQMVAGYEAALLAFDLVLKQNIANSHTAAVWRGLRAQKKSMLNYPSEVACAIATRVIVMYLFAQGNVSRWCCESCSSADY